ncbi:hypothetical protein AX17_001196 [Amanita inopinata Kibby_2008]|nr:hypothetical protein AX17_001196 [Amanita inopinata Kibby_2008]
MCCSGAKWKREEVPDHKFDFVDTREFTDNGFVMRMKYLWLYAVVLKSFLVYVSDVFTAVTMLSTSNWSNEIYNKCQQLDGCVFIDFTTAKWIFFACILFGFLLLAYEAHKAKKIIASRDISYAFTNVMVNNYYSLRSYDHFCFFDHISNSTKTSDDFAFFVFFTFKSWKRLILSDGPRQAINSLTLYALYLSKKDQGAWYDVSKYFGGNSFSTSALTVTTLFTVVVFAGSLLILIVAAICYIPLLCHIQGNLKEYCCHQVDKRIGDVIKRRQRQRLADAARLAKKEAMGDFSHLKNKKGEFIAKPLPQPTLPNLSIDDEIAEASTLHTHTPAPSTYTQDYYYHNHDDFPPPMPSYTPFPGHHQGPHAQFSPSTATLSNDDPAYHHRLYDGDNESTAHLAASAAPFAHHSSMDASSGSGPLNGGGGYDPYEMYQGYAGQIPDTSRRSPMPGGQIRSPSPLVYGHHDIQHQSHPSPSYHQDLHAGYSAQPQPYHTSQGWTGGGHDVDNGRNYNGGYAM